MLAEGIEARGQLERSRDPGCELRQRFLFCAAVPAGEVVMMSYRAPRSESDL